MTNFPIWAGCLGRNSCKKPRAPTAPQGCRRNAAEQIKIQGAFAAVNGCLRKGK
jgi:hypothetical protein